MYLSSFLKKKFPFICFNFLMKTKQTNERFYHPSSNTKLNTEYLIDEPIRQFGQVLRE